MIAALPSDVGAGDLEVDALDLLRVVGGEAGEEQHADRADRQAHRVATGMKRLSDHRDDQADHAHDQEGAEAGQIALGRVALQAEAAKAAAVAKKVSAIEVPV